MATTATMTRDRWRVGLLEDDLLQIKHGCIRTTIAYIRYDKQRHRLFLLNTTNRIHGVYFKYVDHSNSVNFIHDAHAEHVKHNLKPWNRF